MVSWEAKDFLSKILQLDSKDRWKASEIMKHPWLHPPDNPANSTTNNNNNNNVAITELVLPSHMLSDNNNHIDIDDENEEEDETTIQHYDLSTNLPYLRDFYHRRISYLSLKISSNPIQFVKIGRYCCEKMVAMIDNTLSVIDMNIECNEVG
jgi:serine/threonine protein kinase